MGLFIIKIIDIKESSWLRLAVTGIKGLYYIVRTITIKAVNYIEIVDIS